MKVLAAFRDRVALFAILALLLTILPSKVNAQSGGSFDLSRNVIAGGGNTSQGGGVQLSGTAGQAAAGTQTTGGPITQIGGFWPATLNTNVALPVPGPGVLQ